MQLAQHRGARRGRCSNRAWAKTRSNAPSGERQVVGQRGLEAHLGAARRGRGLGRGARDVGIRVHADHAPGATCRRARGSARPRCSRRRAGADRARGAAGRRPRARLAVRARSIESIELAMAGRVQRLERGAGCAGTRCRRCRARRCGGGRAGRCGPRSWSGWRSAGGSRTSRARGRRCPAPSAAGPSWCRRGRPRACGRARPPGPPPPRRCGPRRRRSPRRRSRRSSGFQMSSKGSCSSISPRVYGESAPLPNSSRRSSVSISTPRASGARGGGLLRSAPPGWPRCGSAAAPARPRGGPGPRPARGRPASAGRWRASDGRARSWRGRGGRAAARRPDFGGTPVPYRDASAPLLPGRARLQPPDAREGREAARRPGLPRPRGRRRAGEKTDETRQRVVEALRGRRGRPARRSCASTASPRTGATATSSRSSRAPASSWTASWSRRSRAPSTCTSSTTCSTQLERELGLERPHRPRGADRDGARRR